MIKSDPLSNRVNRLAQAISPTLLSRSSQIKLTGTSVIDLGRGEPESPTANHIIEALISAVQSGETHYTEVEGIFALREAIARKMLRDNKMIVDPRTEVLVTNGAMEGLFLAMMVLVDPGDEVLVLEPFYPHYEGFVTFPGGKPVFIPCLGSDGQIKLNKDELEHRISERSKVLLLNSPNNPTGSILPQETLEMLIETAINHDLMIVTDDVYEAITFTDDAYVCIASFSREVRDRTIVVNSFSKTYAMTGWRLGYVVAPKHILKAMRYVHEKSCRMASAFVQKAGVAAVLGPQDHVQEMVHTYKRRREWVVNSLRGIPGIICPMPDGAFYAFPDISALGISSQEFAERLLEEKHVLVLPGRNYGASGEHHFRLSFATDDSTLASGLSIIREFVVELTGK